MSDPNDLDAELAGDLHLTVDVDADDHPVDVTIGIDDVDAVADAALDQEHVVEVGPSQGLPGPPGPAGERGDRGSPGRDGAPGGALTRVTAGPLAGGRVVVSVGADGVRAADGRTADDAELLLGVCMQSASAAGVDVDVTRLGLVRDQGWAFAVGVPVFCGLDGELTQHPELTAVVWWARVGVAVDVDAVFVDLQPAVHLV